MGDNRPAVIQLQSEILPPPSDFGYSSSLQTLAKVFRHGQSHPSFPDDNFFNNCILQHRHDAAADGFHLRQFGHVSSRARRR